MKRKILQTRTAKTIFALLALFVCLLPSLLRGQTQDYISNKNNILIGTSDTRLTASIYETNDAVTIKLMAIGYLKVDMLSFSFFYNPAELRFCDQNLVEITAFNALQANAAVLSSELTQKGWLLYGTHKNAGLNPLPAYSGHQTMRAVLFDLVSPSSLANLVFEVPAGTVKNVLEFNFKKQTSGKALSEDAIGIAVKTSPVAYQPRFGYDGLFLWYRQEINSLDNREINPNLFLYRSGSSVATYAADPVSLTSATLNGNFLGGAVNLPVSTSILDTTGSATSGTGRLNHDAIQKYGFIYTTSDVNISISEFSDSIKIQNVMYALPTAGEIAAKAFSRGGYNFVIALNDNTLNEPDKNYAIPVLGLTPGENYYAWAYINYNFETSNTYQSVGQRITFTTDYCMAMNIGTVFTVEEPLCNSNNGKIQMFVTGGSGIYEFQIDGGAFKKYDNDIITGLYAGTYTITVRDSLAPVCPSSSIHNVVLHNSATDLNVSLTAQNAATCLDNGTLYVTVTGGVAPYKYYLNNEITETQIPYGMIANKPVGVYTLKVVDGAGCVATSSEVRINADDSNFTAEVLVLDNTTCGESAGRVIMLANSTTPITFQIDGYPEQIWEDYLDLPLLLGDVWSAGVHHIRLNNGCNEIIKEFTVTNGDDALAFKAVPVNEILSCNNALLPGSIILTIENGSGNYQYRIDGGQWQDFITGTTITGLHYGTYRVEIIDTDDDCMYEVNNITIGRETYAPIQVGTIFASKEPACGASNGEITVYATGGSGVYEYSADGVNFTQNNVIGGLKAGTYTITVKDVKYSTCSEVTIPNIVLHNSVTDLNISLTAQNAATCLDNGTLYVSVTGGMAPYKYYLNNETTETQIPYGMINKPVGVYTLKVVDDAGCVATSSEVRINADDSKLAAVVLVTEEAICGSSIGTISVTVENSTDFTYQLDGYPEETVTDYDGTAIIINGLSAGVHYLRVTDACNEIVEKIFITNGTNALAFDAVPANEILSCNNVLLPGSITLTVTNGSGNYQYRIDGGNWQNFISGTTIPGLHYGIYRVEIMDLNNHCTYEVNNITIGRETYAPIQVGTIFASKEPACGASNGEITVYATGGSGVYEYSADGVNFTQNNVIGGLKAGTYTITVKDVKYPTCSEVTIPNIVLHNSVTDLNISLTAQNAATCLDNGTLQITVNGGKTPYKYYFNNEVTETIVTNGTIDKPVGTYTVKVVDNAGCVASSSEVRINADDSKLAAVVLVTEEAICGSSIGTISVTVENSTDFTYQLDGYPEETVTDYDGTAIIINGLSAGIHYLRVTDACNEIVEKIIITNGTDALAFDAVPANETLTCDGELTPGSITLTVSDGAGEYQYSINGATWVDFPASSSIAIIDKLQYGTYQVIVRDLNKCTYEVNNITISRETSYGTLITAPVATSPQTFCSTATVANLQATGVNIHWYLTETGGEALKLTDVLLPDTIYYAAQAFGTCESSVRTAVRVFINDDVVLETPKITSPQYLCGTAGTLELSDIVTDGNTNIVWYPFATTGSPLPMDTKLTDGTTYYAVIEAGDCQSAPRVPVVVHFTSTAPDSVAITSPQYFCEGALIGNIAVPNDHIVWYTAKTGGTALPTDYVLENNTTYFAAQMAGSCESEARTPVLVQFSAPDAPVMPAVQGICGKSTLADLVITGAGIVWYDQEVLGNILPLSTKLEVGKSYWAAQTSLNCEGKRAEVTITDTCYTVYGTMFPFVHMGNAEFDDKFPVTVSLFEVPTGATGDPVTEILNSTPVQTVKASFYDGTVYIPGTPKSPGVIGNTNNPGEEINWAEIGRSKDIVDNTPVTKLDNQPDKPVGMYKFENIVPGDYILEISRLGFVTRWGLVTIDKHGMTLGHRELIAGDVNGDFIVTNADASNLYSGEYDESDPNYDPRFDVNGDGNVNSSDMQIILYNLNANIGTYMETLNWINSYYE